MTWRRARDYVLYFAIGFVVVIAGIRVAGLNVPGPRSAASFNWLGVAAITLALFGSVINSAKRYWRVRSLWLALAIAIAVHAAICWLLRTTLDRSGLLWYFIFYVFEAATASAAMAWCARKSGEGAFSATPGSSRAQRIR